MSDALYNDDWNGNVDGFQSVVTEFEPTFDAAEFTRIGRDIFCQQSQVHVPTRTRTRRIRTRIRTRTRTLHPNPNPNPTTQPIPLL